MATSTNQALANLTASAAPAKPEVKLFKNRLLSCKYIFSDGTTANFVNGKYATANEGEIAELEMQIRKGHQYLYIDTNETTVDYDITDPLASLRKKFFDEFQQQQATAAANIDGRDLGTSKQGPLNATSSKDIAPVTIGVQR
jgi:hypothetical protein